jgi:hypothetical protein
MSSSGTVRLRQSTLHVDHIRRTPDGLLLLEVDGEFAQPPHAFGMFSEWVDVQIEGRLAVQKVDSAALYGFVVTRSDASGNAVPAPFFTPPVSLLFPLEGGATSTASDTGELLLPARQYGQLVRSTTRLVETRRTRLASGCGCSTSARQRSRPSDSETSPPSRPRRGCASQSKRSSA